MFVVPLRITVSIQASILMVCGAAVLGFAVPMNSARAQQADSAVVTGQMPPRPDASRPPEEIVVIGRRPDDSWAERDAYHREEFERLRKVYEPPAPVVSRTAKLLNLPGSSSLTGVTRANGESFPSTSDTVRNP